MVVKGRNMDKVKAENAVANIGKCGEELGAAKEAYIRAVNNKSITRASVAAGYVSSEAVAGNKLSESAADKKAKVSAQYDAACDAEANTAYSLVIAETNLKRAECEYEIAMAS